MQASVSQASVIASIESAPGHARLTDRQHGLVAAIRLDPMQQGVDRLDVRAPSARASRHRETPGARLRSGRWLRLAPVFQAMTTRPLRVPDRCDRALYDDTFPSNNAPTPNWLPTSCARQTSARSDHKFSLPACQALSASCCKAVCTAPRRSRSALRATRFVPNSPSSLNG